MKAINVYYEDDEVEYLEKQKGSKTWKEYFLEISGYKRGE